MTAIYSAIPDHAGSAKTSGYQVGGSEYLPAEGTGSRVSFTKKLMMTAALALSVGTSPALTEANWHTSDEKNSIWQDAGAYAGAGAEAEQPSSPATPAILSAKLQKAFNFKTAQWASVLKVERKTLYNWIKNPETRVQQRVVERIDVMDEFLQEIDAEHAKYVPKFAFGRYPDLKFAEALQQQPLDLNNLIEHYDRLYADFDGFYKRNKHNRSMA